MIDVPAAVRGASAGFSILLVGGLLAPLLALFNSLAGGMTLVATAIGAFFVAARRAGTAGQPALHGAVGASLSYALVLPLVLRSPEGRSLPQILLTIATAISVGAFTGWVASKGSQVERPRGQARATGSPGRPRRTPLD